MTRGHHLTPARRAELDALLLAGAGYKDPRLAGYSQSTITAARRRLGLSPPKVAASVSPSADPPPADPVEIARLKGRVAALAAPRICAPGCSD